MKKLLAPVVLMLLLSSCLTLRDMGGDMGKMIRLLKENKIDYATLKYLVSEDARCSSKLLRERQITCSKLKYALDQSEDPNSGGNGDDSLCIACKKLTFCNITPEDLITNVANYRNHVWSKTTTFTGYAPSSSSFSGDYNNVVNGNSSPMVGSINGFDAQYMDIEIAQMKNYLCAIENVQYPYRSDGNRVKPNTLRFYYTRYDNTTAPIDPSTDLPAPDYINRHSLCIVPVERDANNTTKPQGEVLGTVEYNKQAVRLLWDIGKEDCNNRSMMSNKNMVCPPRTGCWHNTLLQSIP